MSMGVLLFLCSICFFFVFFLCSCGFLGFLIQNCLSWIIVYNDSKGKSGVRIDTAKKRYINNFGVEYIYFY